MGGHCLKTNLSPMWRSDDCPCDLGNGLDCWGLLRTAQRNLGIKLMDIPMGPKSRKQRWSKFLFCGPGFLKVCFVYHVHQHQLEVLGEMQFSRPK